MSRPRKPARATEPPADPSPVAEDEWPEIYPAPGYMRGPARALLVATHLVGEPEECVQSMFGGFRAPPPVVAVTVWPVEPDVNTSRTETFALALQTGTVPAYGVTDAG